MGKILLIVSFVFVLLSAGLGYMGKMKLTESQAQLADMESAKQKASADLANRGKDLKAATDSIATLTVEKEQLAGQVATVQGELTAEKSKSTDALAKATAADTKLAETETVLAATKQELDTLKSAQPVAAGEASPANAEMQAKIDELTTVNAGLLQQTDALKAQVKTYAEERDARITKQLKQGTEGRILAVNPAWNFVVLSLGDKNGVSSNTELLVKRGRQLVGKVRITSVEPSTSVADIVANSVPTGVTISPGDQVIYQAAQD